MVDTTEIEEILSLPVERTKLGRKSWDYELDEIERLSQLACTDIELAGFYRISLRTLQRHKKDDPQLAEAIDKGRANMSLSLRRKQIAIALEEGNPQLLIWLGKQMLGQTDKLEASIGEAENLTPWGEVVAGVDDKESDIDDQIDEDG
jgi:hypothetical protein